jgi:hypothetical protein
MVYHDYASVWSKACAFCAAALETRLRSRHPAAARTRFLALKQTKVKKRAKENVCIYVCELDVESHVQKVWCRELLQV